MVAEPGQGVSVGGRGLAAVEVDVRRLGDLHPRLSPTTVADFRHKAAVGLARHDHRSGVPFTLSFDGLARQTTLIWADDAAPSGEMFDFHDVTEHAAEAIALSLVGTAHGWRVHRRAQREEYADWQLFDMSGGRIALEVSGVNMIDRGQRRLLDKAGQVRRHRNDRALKLACVVELHPPRCRLRTA